MPRADKSSYSDRQRRMAGHIETGYEKRGTGTKEAERRAWATVNKETGGVKASNRGGKRSSGSYTTERRREAAKRGWETRRRNRR